MPDRPLRALLILPSLTEAGSPDWRPIKYSLFPPVGLATLAADFSEEDELELVDEHVQDLLPGPPPDLVLVQAYIPTPTAPPLWQTPTGLRGVTSSSADSTPRPSPPRRRRTPTP